MIYSRGGIFLCCLFYTILQFRIQRTDCSCSTCLQSRVERGFRFLKDLEFFADSIFLSKNERIQSLLMVMTLSLAVFSGLEWKLLHAMKTTGTKLKNQVGKLVDKITIRFVFQEFEEFSVLVGQDGYRI
ncbi:MAG: hypothetical protein J6P43_00730 [Succinivibrionaceae bacterium]|nr:hypothetical protein [Succinivibrionaceae bacterium]